MLFLKIIDLFVNRDSIDNLKFPEEIEVNLNAKFELVYGCFWSCTSDGEFLSNAYAMELNDGYTNVLGNKYDLFNVRAVKSNK